jgi:hypothetical protein
MRTAADGARALADALAARGGTLSEVLVAPRAADGDTGSDEPGPAQIAASGPRAAGREAEYELLLEMILEGARLHYGEPRVVAPEDPDLALLLGDQLYALGLSRLANLGDLPAVAELADVISLVAQAAAVADARLMAAIWQAGAVAIGWGSSAAHEAAKAAARGEVPGAAERLLASAAEGRGKAANS